ncbi:MAG: response regulator transcription factor [Bacteroidota bacterium]
MDQSVKILLVEDDANLGFVIKDNLQVKGYDITLTTDGLKGLEAFNKASYDLCILDVMMPQKDGFSLAEDIRNKDEMVPILFLTAKSMQEDRLNGFRVGGDDYITKPFSIEELILRIEVFLKRTRSHASNSQADIPTIHAIGSYHFNPSKLLLSREGTERALTQKEADILCVFCERNTEILKREFILKTVWGEDDYFLGRSLDVFISKLRKYLKDDPSVEIVNYHGVGFKLEVNHSEK